jgi:hypothetical protein
MNQIYEICIHNLSRDPEENSDNLASVRGRIKIHGKVRMRWCELDSSYAGWSSAAGSESFNFASLN